MQYYGINLFVPKLHKKKFMKRILGLDLGVASIGWAIVDENENTQKIVTAGVRVIPIDTKTADNFSKGVSTSKNQDRRIKRAARRNTHRYRLRKHLLTTFLKNLNLFPINTTLFSLSAAELYGLRHSAIHEQISLEALARIWFHLNQKRGYINSRKGFSEDDKDTKYIEKIKENSKNIYDHYRTIGSYFFHKLQENPLYRIKSGNDENRVFLIEDYMREFDLIWETQQKFYPDILTEQNYNTLRNKIIYYKRKLKSQKILIGDCRYEKHHKSMPISSPIATELRIWQDINNLKIKSKYGEVFELSTDQKLELYHHLNSHAKISEKDLLKKFGFPATKNEYKINFEKDIPGNSYRAKVLQAFDDYAVPSHMFDNFNCLEQEFASHPYFKLWHLLYATEETSYLKKALCSQFNFSENLAEALIKIPIKNDFAALSSRAARKIMPFLREGKKYNEACDAAGYKHADYETASEKEEREIIPIKELKHFKSNALRNPTVEKILNQLINLLMALEADGHRFDEIRIELARDLKNNAKKRQSIFKQNRENEAENKRIMDELHKEGYKSVSKKDIEKYKLWKEFDGFSPYEPKNRIRISDLFDKAQYEVEHIIPKSRYFDDSLMNKTIARTFINKEKNNETAFDYMKTKGADFLHQYEECIKHAKIHPKKKDYLKMAGNQIPDDFINRQLNETRYIAKETLKLLKKVCKNVYSTSGSVTDYLRHHWGYDHVLMDLNFERVAPEEIEIKEINGQTRKVIKNWHKRLDHRHHAVDALVIACTKQSYIQQLNTLNAGFDYHLPPKTLAIKQRKPFEYEEVKTAVANILISFKAGKKVATIKRVGKDRWGKEPGNIAQTTVVPRGALHEESIYGMNKKYSEPIHVSKVKDLNSLAITWQKELVLKHVAKYENDFAAALKNLKKDPIIYDGNKVLDKVVIYFEKPVKRYDLQYTNTNKFDLKAAESIVNENVKRIVIDRLKKFDGKPELAFKNLTDEPLYFNKDKKIVITSVRCYTKTADEQIKPEEAGYIPLHETHLGKTLNTKQASGINPKTAVDYVKGGNNHHIAIYENDNGERVEECVSFFEAFQRKLAGQPIIQKEHPMGYRFVMSLQQNEMFVWGLSKEELQDNIVKRNFALISKHLYRVQKIATLNYVFRHHLETQLDDSKNASDLKKFIKIYSLKALTGFKVRVQANGNIYLIHD